MTKWTPLKLAIGATLAWVILACDPLPTDGSSSSGTTGDGGLTTASGLVPVDVAKVCARFTTECATGTQPSDCTNRFTPLRVTPGCASGLLTASCADITATSSSILSTCFPVCSGTLATCNPDGTITYCTEAGTTEVASCQQSCAAQAMVFSGTCGTQFNGQIATKPQCFCQ